MSVCKILPRIARELCRRSILRQKIIPLRTECSVLCNHVIESGFTEGFQALPAIEKTTKNKLKKKLKEVTHK